MYLPTIIDTESYLHADILRQMLEADGLAAVSATIEDKGREVSLVVTAAPRDLPEQLAVLALLMSTQGKERAETMLAELVSKHPAPEGLAIPVELRNKVRGALLATLHRSGAHVVKSEPQLEALTLVHSKANHDPGDEDDGPTAPAGTRNPAGGGTEERCWGSHDAYDNWKPSRDVSNYDGADW